MLVRLLRARARDVHRAISGETIMNLRRTLRILILSCVLPCAPALAAPPQFAVVRVVHFDKSETNQVMSGADYQTLQADVRKEATLFTRAAQLAADDWKKDEVLRARPFPASLLAARQASVVGSVYDSEQKAAAALDAMLTAKARMEGSRKKPKGTAEKDERLESALELLTDHLAELKGVPVQAQSTANKIELKPGQTLSRKTEGPQQTSYHIAVPDTFKPEKPPPLLLMFSPGGDGRGMMNQVRASANKVGWMVIGCDRLKNGMNGDEEIAIQTEFLADVRKFIPYDPARLYYGGFSGGAMRGYHMTHEHKDRCAGILAFGGWLGMDDKITQPFQKKMAVAMVNGEGDKGALAYEDRDRGVLRHRNCDVKIFHFPGGHGVAPVEVIDEAIAWMDSQAAGKSTGASPAGRPSS